MNSIWLVLLTWIFLLYIFILFLTLNVSFEFAQDDASHHFLNTLATTFTTTEFSASGIILSEDGVFIKSVPVLIIFNLYRIFNSGNARIIRYF